MERAALTQWSTATALRSALPAQRRNSLAHLLALLLAAPVRAQPLLRQLQSALEGRRRANLQQLNHAALIGCKARHFANDFPDHLDPRAQLALAVGRLGAHLAPCRDEATVQAHRQARRR